MSLKTKSEKLGYAYQGGITSAQMHDLVQMIQLWASTAQWYGFDIVPTFLTESPEYGATLLKSGFIEEKQLIRVEMEGEKSVLRPSTVLSLLQLSRQHLFDAFAPPLKLASAGESAERTGGGVLLYWEASMCVVGEETPVAEAEMLQILWQICVAGGVDEQQVRVVVNTEGCEQCRGSFRSALQSYVRQRSMRLCRNCKSIVKKAPHEIFQCRQEKCVMVAAGAPQILDFLCDTCKKQLCSFLEYIDEMNIPYFLDSHMTRKAPWFSSLIFSVVERKLNERDEKDELDVEARNQEQKEEEIILAQGGCISRAAELMVGKKIDAAAGTLLPFSLLGLARTTQTIMPPPDVFLVQLGELAMRKSMALLELLRKGGIRMNKSLGTDSLKAQLKLAEGSNARIALIFGQKEALDKTVILRDVASGAQEIVPQDRLISFLHKRLFL
ncbi:MAG: histidyl-tRNA synthetase [Parcubacteria group bacterium Gr01-1014_66]|nr:MAG: histidyl-tRNA synthetase [Parcubacteria group bacterium Gr01-1014_66]